MRLRRSLWCAVLAALASLVLLALPAAADHLLTAHGTGPQVRECVSTHGGPYCSPYQVCTGTGGLWFQFRPTSDVTGSLRRDVCGGTFTFGADACSGSLDGPVTCTTVTATLTLATSGELIFHYSNEFVCGQIPTSPFGPPYIPVTCTVTEEASGNLTRTQGHPPSRPTLQAVASPSGINLTWSTANDGGEPITNHTLEQDESGWWSLTLGSATAYDDTGTGDGVTYSYKVKAVNVVGSSPFSSAVTLLAQGPLPGPPRLRAQAGPGVGEIQLSWDAAAPGASAITRYDVYAKYLTSSEALLASVSGTTFTYTETGLAAGTDRYYRVAAVNDAGAGPKSDQAHARTFQVPDAPQNVSATRGPGGGEISLAWSPPSADGGTPVLTYHVHRAYGGPFEPIASTTALTFTNRGLPPDTGYDYRIIAENLVGNGTVSQTVFATTFPAPSPPRDFLAEEGPGAGEVSLRWNASADDGGLPLTGYKVYRSTAQNGTYTLVATLGDVLTYRNTGLPNGESYWYYATATSDAGEGGASTKDHAYTYALPNIPRNTSAQPGPGAGAITISWEPPVQNANHPPLLGYVVYRNSTTGTPDTEIATVGPDARTFTDTGLGNGVTKVFGVRAKNLVGLGNQDPRTATTFRVPEVPRDLAAAMGPGPGNITVSWQAPAQDGGLPISGYKVHRATSSGGPYSLVASLGVQLSFKDTGLPDSATRHYKVAAVNAAGEGAAAGPVTGRTQGVPGAPRALAASPGPGLGNLSLSWQSPAEDGGAPVSGYSVYRASSSGGPFTLVATLGDVRSFVDTGLPTGVTRHYQVSARNEVGEGPRSDEASATTPTVVPPSAPRDLGAAAGPGAGQIRLTWTSPADDGGSAVTGYRVYRSTSSAGPFSVVATLGNVSSFVDGNLPNNATRYYRVAAENVAGIGAQSSVAGATTFRPPSAPRNLQAQATTSLSFSSNGLGLGIKLSWQAPSDNGGTAVTAYRIFRSASASSLGTLVGTVDGATLLFQDSHADPLKRNYYSVVAVNVAGASPPAGPLCGETYPWQATPGSVGPLGGNCP